jgi:hypothetical protein
MFGQGFASEGSAPVDKALIFIIFGLVFGFIALPIAHGRILDGPQDTLRRRFPSALSGARYSTQPSSCGAHPDCSPPR